MKDKENYKVRIIPPNYEIGINIFGMNFSTRFLFEGALYGSVLGIIAYQVLKNIKSLEKGNVIGLVLMMVLIGLFIGVKGFNDEPISVFVKNYLRINSRKRKAFYNPRVKEEIKPFYDELADGNNDNNQNKLSVLIDKIRANIDSKNEKKALLVNENSFFDASKMYFSDDEGYSYKPLEYMSNKELKRYKKLQKKKLKNISRRGDY